MVTLQLISPENRSFFRDVRLRALRDSPTAFGSTYAREVQLTDGDWSQRSHRWTSPGSIGYLAFDGERACGVVACYTEEENLLRGHIVSMWVDPDYRREGVGQLLIEGVRSWAVARGLRELKLMVTSVNMGAIRFYERLGFQMTGLTGPYPNAPSIFEHEMIQLLQS
jgi:ribosomal protein S18 acetylase RimI-like enzyme